MALALTLALLWPHVQWVLAHEGVTFKYVQEQGDGHIYFKGLVTFALSPILYWLPAWWWSALVGGLCAAPRRMCHGGGCCFVGLAKVGSPKGAKTHCSLWPLCLGRSV